ncbi:MAG TPA: hypothetical protein VF669_10190, partial [Tepidisphaeraceae bacterium]
MLEPLEGRQLMSSVWFDSGNGQLNIYGDNGRANTITVAKSGSSAIARVNDKQLTVDAGSIRKIYIAGGDQVDNVWADINFTCSEEIRTYGGNDTISSSNGNDTIN